MASDLPVKRSATARFSTRVGLFVLALVLLGALIVTKPTRNLQDFDQPFYVTLAYDLDRYGVFSNGPFSGIDDTATTPAPGMFFGPVYPALVATVMKLDPRFAAAVRCSVEANRGHRDITICDPYDLPMRLLNALLLAIAVVAIAAAAELMFRRRAMFRLAGLCVLVALACEASAFSYIMTESVIFAIYSVFMLAIVLAWRSGRAGHFILGGVLLGLLCLAKPSYLVLFPIVAALSFVYLHWLSDPRRPHALGRVLAFSLAFGCVAGAWVVRNGVSVGKFGFTEEYGAVVLIERFAYNDMTVREFFQAFPYCTPGLGEIVFDPVYGADSMHRFTYHTDGSFFHVGRGRRDALVAQYGRLDPLIPGIIRDEMRNDWWRHLLVSIPLAWCGLWAGWLSSLVLVPLFAWACVRAVRTRQPLLLLYATPAVAMLGLDALIGNHYTRYNLILIGPYAVGAASLITSWLPGRPGTRWRWRSPASASLSAPSASAASDAGSTSPSN
jgi:4-amino-4-deoxy-L-arabinose transferase-like glycosyltransferase